VCARPCRDRAGGTICTILLLLRERRSAPRRVPHSPIFFPTTCIAYKASDPLDKRTHIHTYIHTYTHIYTYVHTHIHTYTHTHRHTNVHLEDMYIYAMAVRFPLCLESRRDGSSENPCNKRDSVLNIYCVYIRSARPRAPQEYLRCIPQPHGTPLSA
jgi:hypothetical protein